MTRHGRSRGDSDVGHRLSSLSVVASPSWAVDEQVPASRESPCRPDQNHKLAVPAPRGATGRDESEFREEAGGRPASHIWYLWISNLILGSTGLLLGPAMPLLIGIHPVSILFGILVFGAGAVSLLGLLISLRYPSRAPRRLGSTTTFHFYAWIAESVRDIGGLRATLASVARRSRSDDRE